MGESVDEKMGSTHQLTNSSTLSDPIIQVKHLSKKYRIGMDRSYKTFCESAVNALKSPVKTIKNLRKQNDTFWALKDINLEVKRGEVVGIIGRNGAGKTTLLKILSQITYPTEGEAILRGRVASLLEVGTGFHPELTGRENIYFNGAILGMRKQEIEDKFDEIVQFAEIEKFLDTPVKRYSSGMYVRLAFAVAAHLEPDILLVDEVLAVGDVMFQKKCLGKMSDVAKAGRTVLFVSHNMGAVGRLCHRGLLLDQGRLVYEGNMSEVINRYTEGLSTHEAELYFSPDSEKKIQIRRIRLLDHTGKPSTKLNRDYPFQAVIEYEVREEIVAHIAFMLDRADGLPVCHSADTDTVPGEVTLRRPGYYRSVVEFPGSLLNASTYQIRIGIAKSRGIVYDYCEAFVFHLEDYGSFAAASSGGKQRPGVLVIPLKWSTERLDESL